MAKKRTSVDGEKPSVGGELIIPTAGILFTLYYFSTITDAPWTAQVNAFFVGSILILLSAIFIALKMMELRRGSVRLSFRELIEPVDVLGKRLMLLAIASGYVLIVDYAGFTITTFLLLFTGMTALGLPNIRRNFTVALSLSLGVWFVFVYVFETRLPYGPFENLMKGLI